MAGPLHLIVAPAAENDSYELQSRPASRQREHDQILAAVEKLNQTYHLEMCELPGAADEKMVRLREWRSKHIGKWQGLAAYILCKKPFIAVGKLGPTNNMEAQTFHETQFESLVRSEILTRGYARPQSLVDSADVFVRALPSFCERPDEDAPIPHERYALVVALEVDRCRVSIFMLLMVLLGLAVGMAVSIVKRDLGLGAEVGAAVFGFVAVFQGTMIFMFK